MSARRARRRSESATAGRRTRGRAAPPRSPAATQPEAEQPIGLPLHPRAMAGAMPPVAGVVPLRVLALEATQVIQDLQHSVRLIAGKSTVVRVYLDPEQQLVAPVVVSGELAWRRGVTGPVAFLPSMNTLALGPGATPSLLRRRADVGQSLNFVLPAAALAAGTLEVRLNRVMVVGGPDATLAGPGTAAQVLRLDAGASLRVRVIGLRYVVPATGQPLAPDAVHFEFIRSWLGRAYPVAAFEWSQIVVDANFTAPFVAPSATSSGTTGLANAQIAALRAADVASGTDPRTHYYGLVADAGGAHFLRGLAFGIPPTADPSVVASGPAGVPNGFAGDLDRSYADWYTAHELGHTFGRFHSGFPPGQQDASDPAFPHPNGQISDADERGLVGFDVGDPALGLTMRALPGDLWHDVMTYADNQWLSEHTYEAIYQRLLEEDQLGPPTV
jgi:hypothetical protein